MKFWDDCTKKNGYTIYTQHFEGNLRGHIAVQNFGILSTKVHSIETHSVN